MTADTKESSTNMLHDIKGQHEEDGVLYLQSTPKELLNNIKSYELTSQDLLISTFSKSGK
jgi:hypothetical protein